MDRAGVPVYVVTQELSHDCGRRRIPVRVLRDEISQHEDWEPTTSFTGLFGSTRCMALASSCYRPEVAQHYSLYPNRPKSLHLLSESVGPSGGKHNSQNLGPDPTENTSR
jgi:hypothetical protein